MLVTLSGIVAFPFEIAVTLPFCETDAIAESELDQVINCVLSKGNTVAIKSKTSPQLSDKIISFKEILLVSSALLTVTTHEAVILSILAIIVVVPCANAVTTPVEDAVAIDGSELDQMIFLRVALEGKIVAVRVKESPHTRSIEDLFSVIFVTATLFFVYPQIVHVSPSKECAPNSLVNETCSHVALCQ